MTHRELRKTIREKDEEISFLREMLYLAQGGQPYEQGPNVGFQPIGKVEGVNDAAEVHEPEGRVTDDEAVLKGLFDGWDG